MKKSEYQLLKFTYHDGLISGKILDKGTYINDNERLASVQIIGVKDFSLIGDEAKVNIIKEGEGQTITTTTTTHKTVKVEKLEEFEMIVLLDVDVNLMNEHWEIDLKIK